MADAARLILASGSAARCAMLEASGLAFEVVPASLDENAITEAMMRENARVEAADIASALAIEKALSVARAHPGALVIGADQTLALGTRLISKAATMAEARDILDTLRGRTHDLISAVALARDHEILWQGIDSAQMTMRRFSDEFLAIYLKRVGAQALKTVGCYELEGLGAQLFERIDGDYFTVLGMPLLPLLAALRNEGVIAT